MILIGCESEGGGFATDFHTGTKGIELEFLENTPPDEILSGRGTGANNFLIGVGIKNKGGEDANGTLLVSITPNKNEFKIEGHDLGQRKKITSVRKKSVEFFEGEFIPIFFDVESFALDESVKEKIFNVEAKMYYDYRTVVTTDICIDPNLKDYFGIRKNACKSKNIRTLSQGQGAPIIISKIEQDMIYKKGYNQLVLTIFLEDKGNERNLEKLARYDGCDDFDEVEIKDIRFSDFSFLNGKITCEGLEDVNKIRFYVEDKKEVSIKCYADLSRDLNTYNTPLFVEFEYGYRTTATKSFKVKNLEYEEEEEPLPIPSDFRDVDAIGWSNVEGWLSSISVPDFFGWGDKFDGMDIRDPCDDFGNIMDRMGYVEITFRDYKGLIASTASNKNIDPCFLTALIRIESDFKERAVSPTGAAGLMQFVVSTGKRYLDVPDYERGEITYNGKKVNVPIHCRAGDTSKCEWNNDQRFNPILAIPAGADHINFLLGGNGDDIEEAMADWRGRDHPTVSEKDWDTWSDNLEKTWRTFRGPPIT